jgi:hypothetical protein
MYERLIFACRFSSGFSCNVEIMNAPWDGRLRFTTQEGQNEIEQWFKQDGSREPTFSDYVASRADECPDHHDLFDDYRDCFVPVIIPIAVEKWNIPVSAYIVGWRPHQQDIWDCEPGQKPAKRAVEFDPETGAPTVPREHRR